MKKITICTDVLSASVRLFLLVLCAASFVNANAQTLTSMSPNEGQLGEMLNVTISGQDTDFSVGTPAIQTTLNRGGISIPLSFVSSSNDELEVNMDLTAFEYPSGFYDLEVITSNHGSLTLNNAFEIDSVGLTTASPNFGLKGQGLNVIVTGRSVDFTTLPEAPIYFKGSQIINTTIVGTQGMDTLELMVDLTLAEIKEGNYDLKVITSSDTLILRNALEVGSYTISGTVYFDRDSNGVQDPNENGLSGVKVKLFPQNYVAYSNGKGNFNFSHLDSGEVYDVRVYVPEGAKLTNGMDSVQTVTMPSSGSFSVAFGFQSRTQEMNNNTMLTLVSGRARCEATVEYSVFLRNSGFLPGSGVVKLVKHPDLEFSANTVSMADSIAQDSVYFSFEAIPAGELRILRFMCDLPSITVMPIGTFLMAFAECNLIDTVGEMIPDTYQYSEAESEVKCSYDPNDKKVEPRGVGDNGLVLKDSRFSYTIRFQNTGNDTAYNVVLVDTLSSRLDYSTFEFLVSSHEVYTVLDDNGVLRFNFKNIFLVDSATNEEGSNGFVKFRISPHAGLDDSTTVTNRADIYFDFNPPVLTNVVSNMFVSEIVSVQEEMGDGIGVMIYPNPNNGTFKIALTRKVNQATVTVFDMFGRKMFEKSGLNGKRFDLDLDDFSKGFYLVRITDKNKQVTKKILIEP